MSVGKLMKTVEGAMAQMEPKANPEGVEGAANIALAINGLIEGTNRSLAMSALLASVADMLVREKSDDDEGIDRTIVALSCAIILRRKSGPLHRLAGKPS